MEFRQLEALRLVVESGSFSEAARLMNVTQPSVSAQISALEKEFGCPLVVRRPGRAVPTERGRILCHYAAEILALRDKAVARCGVHPNMGGALTIAASSIPYQFVLPVLMAEFAMKYPGVQFSLLGADSMGAAQMVLDGRADLGMTGTLHESGQLVFEAVLEDELVVMTPVAKPYTAWPAGAAPPTEDIVRAPFVAREAGSGTWAEMESHLRRQGHDIGALHIVAQMDNPDAIAKAVEQGMGITILSDLAANDYARRGRVLLFPLAETPVRRKVYLVRHAARPLPPPARAFLQFATRQEENASL